MTNRTSGSGERPIAPIGEGLETAIWQLVIALILKATITVFTFGIKVRVCCMPVVTSMFCVTCTAAIIITNRRHRSTWSLGLNTCVTLLFYCHIGCILFLIFNIKLLIEGVQIKGAARIGHRTDFLRGAIDGFPGVRNRSPNPEEAPPNFAAFIP